jgi:hypothetical protein
MYFKHPKQLFGKSVEENSNEASGVTHEASFDEELTDNSTNRETGNRWWKERAKCGASKSLNPHTAQSVGSSDALALHRGHLYPVRANT